MDEKPPSKQKSDEYVQPSQFNEFFKFKQTDDTE